MTDMRQVLISNGKTRQTVWIENDARLKPHCEITLKDSEDKEARWKVLKMYDKIIEKNTLYKPWKVGGLE
jgi:hypothetical protein